MGGRLLWLLHLCSTYALPEGTTREGPRMHVGGGGGTQWNAQRAAQRPLGGRAAGISGGEYGGVNGGWNGG